MTPDNYKQKLEEVIQDINNEYGQDDCVRLHHRSMDVDGFHFEFGPIYGMAIFEMEYPGGHKQLQIQMLHEDDDFWHVGPGQGCASAAWIPDMYEVMGRVIKYLKKQ